MRSLLVLLVVVGCSTGNDEVRTEVEAADCQVKVKVCHIPPGKPRHAHTIEVASSAVAAHLGHGDYTGACQTCPVGSTVSCYSGPAGTSGVGACHAGTQTCSDGVHGYGACAGEVTPVAEVCGDGIDNDCDGATDEGCVCAAGTTSACYDGPDGTAGVGTCAAGTQICNATGTDYGACTGSVGPTAEVCGDGMDNDCDGTIDNGCVCSPGSSEGCYDGPEGTLGVGACGAGVHECNADGSAYGACAGSITPTAEVCGDDIDNDCDGVVDDNCVCAPNSTAACYDGPAGTNNVGTCAAGTMTCNTDGTAYGACVGTVGPVAEVCGDGLDNDCDGAADDGCVCNPGETRACWSDVPETEDVGLCVSGSQTCNADGSAWGDCAGETLPAPDICADGKDNNCDGVVDETCFCAPNSTARCYRGPDGTAGIGACRAGTQTCAADGSAYSECSGDDVPVAELCGDGIDNDCDGRTDNGCIGDFAWLDLDDNGLQNVGEPGVAGATLMLRSATTGALVMVTVSDVFGAYHFSNIPAGEYYAEAILPPNFMFAMWRATENDVEIDNDFDGDTSATLPFTFTGEATPTIDLGVIQVSGT